MRRLGHPVIFSGIFFWEEWIGVSNYQFICFWSFVHCVQSGDRHCEYKRCQQTSTTNILAWISSGYNKSWSGQEGGRIDILSVRIGIQYNHYNFLHPQIATACLLLDSVFVLADTSVSPPWKLFIFIIKIMSVGQRLPYIFNLILKIDTLFWDKPTHLEARWPHHLSEMCSVAVSAEISLSSPRICIIKNIFVGSKYQQKK